MKKQGGSSKKSVDDVNRNSGQARRKTLKAMLAGGGAVAASQAMPSKWGTPIVEATVLPVHAQTTQCIVYDRADTNNRYHGCVEICGEDASVNIVIGYANCGGGPKFRFTGTLPANGDWGEISRVETGAGCSPGSNFLSTRDAYIFGVGPQISVRFREGDGGTDQITLNQTSRCTSHEVDDCNEC